MEDGSQLDALQKHTNRPVDNIWTVSERDCRFAVMRRIVLASSNIEVQLFANKHGSITIYEGYYHSTLTYMAEFILLLWKIAEWRGGESTKARIKSQQVTDDCIRLLSELQHLDARRAVWCLTMRPDECDPSLKRFATTRKLLGNAFYVWDESWEGCLNILGHVFWQVSVHIPRSLSPEPPPPPYTLFAFNIELPEINLRTATTRACRRIADNSQQPSKRKRTYADDIEHVRKQRLLRFEPSDGKANTGRRLLSVEAPRPMLALPPIAGRVDVDDEASSVPVGPEVTELTDMDEHA
jgi:hypothetical protein